MKDVLAFLRKHWKFFRQALSYFVAGFILDLLIAKEYIYITLGWPIAAALVSGIITIISVFIVSKIIKHESGGVMVSYALGNAFGTYFAM